MIVPCKDGISKNARCSYICVYFRDALTDSGYVESFAFTRAPYDATRVHNAISVFCFLRR